MNTPELEHATLEIARDVRFAFGPTACHVEILMRHALDGTTSVTNFAVSDTRGYVLPPLYAFVRSLPFRDALPVTLESQDAYLKAVIGDDDETALEHITLRLCHEGAGLCRSMLAFLDLGPKDNPDGMWFPLDLPAENNMILIPWSTADVLCVREDLTEEQAARVLAEAEGTYDPVRGLNWTVLREVADRLYPPTPPSVYLMVLCRPGSALTFEWRWTPEEVWDLFDQEVDRLRSMDLEGRVTHLMTTVPLDIKNDGDYRTEVHLTGRLEELMRVRKNKVAVYEHVPPCEP